MSDERTEFLDRINRPALARLLDGMLDTEKTRSGPGMDRIVACGNKKLREVIFSGGMIFGVCYNLPL